MRFHRPLQCLRGWDIICFMKTRLMTAFVLAAAAWLVHAPCAMSQPLTPEEIVTVMNASFKPAAAACTQGKTLPDAAKLTVTIGKDGAAALESVSPPLGVEVETCLSAAVAKAAFRASGQAFKMVYSYKIPTAAEPISTAAEPIPTEPTPTGAGPEPTPTAAPVAPSGGGEPPPSAAVTMHPTVDAERPPDAAPESKPGEIKTLENKFRVSRSLMILGFAGFGAFWISMVVTSLVLWVGDSCIGYYDDDDCPVTEGHYVKISAAVPLVGPFFSGPGLRDNGFEAMGNWYLANGVLQISLLAMGFAGLGIMVTSYKKLRRARAGISWTLLPTASAGMHGESVPGAALAGTF